MCTTSRGLMALIKEQIPLMCRIRIQVRIAGPGCCSVSDKMMPTPTGSGFATLHVDVQRLRFVNFYQWSGSALDLMLIRIQHMRSMRDRNRNQGFKDKKFQIWHLKKFIFLPIKNVNSCNPMKSKLQEKPSALKRKHPALQKTWHCFTFFLFLWISFVHLDPDPAGRNQWGSDPDAQHWL